MRKVEVRSSQMKLVEYDSVTKVLIVTFNNDKRYSYSDVPEEVFEGLISADSIGSYFIKKIKNNKDYKYQLLEA